MKKIKLLFFASFLSLMSFSVSAVDITIARFFGDCEDAGSDTTVTSGEACIIQSIINALSKAKEMTRNEIPIAILLHTEMGNGVDFMMGTHKWHGSAPNDKQLLEALSQNTETLGDY